MTLSELLTEAKARQQVNVNRINALEQEKQATIQETLKLDGEIRVLTKLTEEEKKP